MISGKRLLQKSARAVRVLEGRTRPIPAWRLSCHLGLYGDQTHRDTRRVVGHLCRVGIPVIHTGAGYKLARTPGEIARYEEKLRDQVCALNHRREQVSRYRRLFTEDGYDHVGWARTGRRSGRLGALLELLTGAEV